MERIARAWRWLLMAPCLCSVGEHACSSQTSEPERAAAIAAVEAAGGRVFLENTLIREVRFGHLVTDDGLRSLLAVPESEGVIVWGAIRVTDQGLAPLAKLRHLRRVILSACIVGDPAMEHLKGATELMELNVSHTRVTGKGLMKLSKLKNLRELDVSGTSITDADLRLVENWPALRKLRIFGTKVTDAGLANLKATKNLEYLYLTGLPITDAGVVHLTKLAKLRWITLSNTKVTEKGVQILRKALPDARIVLER